MVVYEVCLLLSLAKKVIGTLVCLCSGIRNLNETMALKGNEPTGEEYPYNQSMKSVYKDILLNKMSKSKNSDHTFKRELINKRYDESGMHTSSMHGTVDRGMIQEDSFENDSDTNNEYNDFKKTILNDKSIVDVDDDDEWLDETDVSSDQYADEADESFIESYVDSDIDSNGDSYHNNYYDDDSLNNTNEYYHDASISSNKFLRDISIGITVLLVGFMLLPLLFGSGNNATNQLTRMDSKSVSNIQRQINHLYGELTTKNEKYQSDFDKTIQVVISQFEKNIKKLIPLDLLDLKSQLELLNSKFNALSSTVSHWGSVYNGNQSSFSMDNITEWQNKLLEELQTKLPNEIPVIVNNSSDMLVIPELHDYISEVLSSLVQHIEPSGSRLPLAYDLNEYMKEFMENQLQYVEKNYFIQELNRKLQLNKHEIFEEIYSKVEELGNNKQGSLNVPPEQYSNILLKKLVHKIYNANQYQWEDDLDFGTFAQGTRILNHLTSPTWKNGYGASPLELLSNSPSNAAYWQCSSTNDCSFAIRFQQPIYLFKLSYLHGRLTNNIHMMNSAPKKISIYVKLANDPDTIKKLNQVGKAYNQGQSLKKDSSYIRIGQYEYNLADPKIKQQFSLPSWFIKLRPLVHSMVFQVDENYGNKHFTSLRKFNIKAVTMQDLLITKRNDFPFRSGDIPDFSSPEFLEDFEKHHLKHPTRSNNEEQNIVVDNDDIPSFGEDELDI